MAGFKEVLSGRVWVRIGDRFVVYLEQDILIGRWHILVRERNSTTKHMIPGTFYDCSQSSDRFYSPDNIKHQNLASILTSVEKIVVEMGYD